MGDVEIVSDDCRERARDLHSILRNAAEVLRDLRFQTVRDGLAPEHFDRATRVDFLPVLLVGQNTAHRVSGFTVTSTPRPSTCVLAGSGKSTTPWSSSRYFVTIPGRTGFRSLGPSEPTMLWYSPRSSSKSFHEGSRSDSP